MDFAEGDPGGRRYIRARGTPGRSVRLDSQPGAGLEEQHLHGRSEHGEARTEVRAAQVWRPGAAGTSAYSGTGEPSPLREPRAACDPLTLRDAPREASEGRRKLGRAFAASRAGESETRPYAERDCPARVT